jgi:XisI protein
MWDGKIAAPESMAVPCMSIFKKIWVQHDGTEDAIADQLVEKGVPKKDIVLAYHAPYVRQYTEFALG